MNAHALYLTNCFASKSESIDSPFLGSTAWESGKEKSLLGFIEWSRKIQGLHQELLSKVGCFASQFMMGVEDLDVPSRLLA